jgi:hypothetical protein
MIPGYAPGTTRSFCLGKRTQNHFCPCVALWVPYETILNPEAAQLAPLRQCSPSLLIWLRFSATPEGGNSRGHELTS